MHICLCFWCGEPNTTIQTVLKETISYSPLYFKYSTCFTEYDTAKHPKHGKELSELWFECACLRRRYACFGLPGCVSVWFRCHLSSIVLSIRSVDVHMLVYVCGCWKDIFICGRKYAMVFDLIMLLMPVMHTIYFSHIKAKRDMEIWFWNIFWIFLNLS